MSDRDERLIKIVEINRTTQRFAELYLGRFPREPDIQQEIGEKVMAWEYVTCEWPKYLVLGVNSFLRLYEVFRDLLLPLGDGPGHRGVYQGMTIVIIPAEEFVEVSSGCDWSRAHYVRDSRPHMGKGETENAEDDEKGLSTGPGGLCSDDDSPQGESWEGPVPVPSPTEA